MTLVSAADGSRHIPPTPRLREGGLAGVGEVGVAENAGQRPANRDT